MARITQCTPLVQSATNQCTICLNKLLMNFRRVERDRLYLLKNPGNEHNEYNVNDPDLEHIPRAFSPEEV